MDETVRTAPFEHHVGSQPTHDGDTGTKLGDAGQNSKQNAEIENNTRGDRGLHNKKYGKQSFASLFKDNRAPVEASLLRYIQPLAGELIIGSEEIESVEKTFGYCLVGYVMGPRPSAFTVLNFIKRWGGNVKFLFKENGWIKFKFSSELERDSVLNGGPYIISGRQLFLKQLPSCFLYSKEDMVFLPSWVQIYGLPADCWTVPALSKIASVVGKPIHTDQLTISKKGSTYARVLVEIDAKKTRIWDYPVILPTGVSTVVKFKYEMDPKFCSTCNSLGHLTGQCGMNNQKNINTQHMKPNEIKINNSTAAGKKDVTTIIEEPIKNSKDVPESSSTKENLPPMEAVTEQQNTASNKLIRDRGKAPVPMSKDYSEQQHDVFWDDDLLSCDGTERPLTREEDLNIDSDDLEDILSRVQTQDKEEWKIVSKKNRRNRSMNTNALPYSKAYSGTSSMDTEYVPIDPKSKKPMTGDLPRVFKKTIDEARRPDTASRSQ